MADEETLDFSNLKPRGVSTVEVSEQQFRKETYYVLHNTEIDTYIKLNATGFFLWSMMDGEHSLGDIATAYFTKFGSMPFDQLSELLNILQSNSFLEDVTPIEEEKPYKNELSGDRSHSGGAKHFLANTWAKISTSEITINANAYFGWAYRHGGRLFFTKPAQITFAILSVIGVVLFLIELTERNYSLLKTGDSYVLGIITLFLLNTIVLLIHEHAHGLTVKHYNRKVISGGFVLYWGLLCMFVNTTDMWMGTKNQRIAVSWAGPYAGLIIGSVCAIGYALYPSSTVAPLLFQASFLGMLNLLQNLVPFLEWDGYYMLMNYMEMPNLRAEAFSFIKAPLWRKLFIEKGNFSHDERIFILFGFLSALWTAGTIYLVLHLWANDFYPPLKSLWDTGKIGDEIVVLILVGIVSLLLAGSIGVKIWNGLKGTWFVYTNRRH